MAQKFDVIVVGGSLAGSTVAFQLASRGARVALFERETFPRRKVCGEGLSHTGFRLLQEAGLTSAIQKVPFQPYDRFIVHDTADNPTSVLSRNGSLGYGVAREQLDSALFQAAAGNPNVTMFHGAQVKEISQDLDQVTVSTADGSYNASFLVLAAGSQNGFEVPEQKTNLSPIRYGFSFRISGVSRVVFSSVHAFLRDGFQVLCTPISDNTLNISVLITKNRVAHTIETLQLEAQKLAASFFESWETSMPVLSCGAIGRVRRPPTFGRILLTGDSCEQFDPIGGMGMTHAILCATLAVPALLASIADPAEYKRSFAEYARVRELEVRPLRGFTRLSYSTLTKDTWLGTRLRRNATIGQLVSSTVHGMHSSKQRALMLGLLALIGTEL